LAAVKRLRAELRNKVKNHRESDRGKQSRTNWLAYQSR
jgi:hypothetical protein